MPKRTTRAGDLGPGEILMIDGARYRVVAAEEIAGDRVRLVAEKVRADGVRESWTREVGKDEPFVVEDGDVTTGW